MIYEIEYINIRIYSEWFTHNENAKSFIELTWFISSYRLLLLVDSLADIIFIDDRVRERKD